MFSKIIKEETKTAHQQVEAKIVRQIKAIKNEAEYADLLKGFYAFFSAVEAETEPYISTEILPDKLNRRNSTFIKKDIESLGFEIDNLPPANAPKPNSVLEALSSMYVLEGSIMGGPYIIQMLKKAGIQRGFSFFEGYAEQSQNMWNAFTSVLNQHANNHLNHTNAIEIANKTFYNFADVFHNENIHL
ncbi:biliverdin-producing heme oxygenase [Sphingobacterium endophyticum]|uniref:biliverdin-producing heme oxygenase n=1 Tax=Sphingobacterium endophyticum TaxID=2546448 RepID=UPI0012E1D838|nr:biliverdin-producing heme oxygenase [Sphingobacterium endophyticum]